MAEPDSSLDLRLTPDWLKDPEPTNRYADFEGENPDRRRGGFHRRDGSGGQRRGPDDRQRRGAPDRRSPGSGPGPAGTTARRPPGDQRRPPYGGSPYGGSQSGTQQRSDRGDRNRFPPREEARPVPPVEAAPVQVDFLPEERAFTKIIQQIKSGHIAYPLFGLARMFLERPERHRVRVRSQDNHTMLYQLGDHGPIAMDPATLERIAFAEHKDDFYETEVIEKEPLKGNFTSVARCTLSGRLLGPSNYHTFQPLIRSLYEQRFSRRMSFEEYRRTIETVTDPETVNQWKEEARKSVIYKTKGTENPATFESLAAVEPHFREHHLRALMKPCLAAEISGELARHLPDRGILAAVRAARDRENRFPAQIAGALRHGLSQSGLHVFKHKKRILYISTVRPQVFNSSQTSLSTGLAAVLSTLRSYPKITRKQLAEKVLAKTLGQAAPDENSTEYQHGKTVLAGDLIWLAKAGHVIEFADGTLDLPLPPKPVEEKGPSKGAAGASGPVTAAERGDDRQTVPPGTAVDEEEEMDEAGGVVPGLEGSDEQESPAGTPVAPAELRTEISPAATSDAVPGPSPAIDAAAAPGPGAPTAGGIGLETVPAAEGIPHELPARPQDPPPLRAAAELDRTEVEGGPVENEPSTEAEWVAAHS